MSTIIVPMIQSVRFLPIIAVSLCLVVSASGLAQVVPPPNPPAATSVPLPTTTQIRKTVIFLQTDCLTDFGPAVAQLRPDAPTKLTPDQLRLAKQNLGAMISRFRQFKPSLAKLTAMDVESIQPTELPKMEIPQLGVLLVKMAALTDEDLAQLSPKEAEALPIVTWYGTGFIVSVPDERLIIPPDKKGLDFGFGYLVTNRHVAQPGIETGNKCAIVRSFFFLKKNGSGKETSQEKLYAGNNLPWHFSKDDSVDLAVMHFAAPGDLYDYMRIPIADFVTEEMVQNKKVVEGAPVLFSGLFIQTFVAGQKLEPIVRSGTLAMVPEGLMETTLNKLGKVYLAEAHAFGGNSGSPMFIDINKLAGIISGPSYHLLGVVSGEVHEGADLTLQTAASFNAQVSANSDVSMIVPAQEVRAILYSPELQAERDAAVAKQK
jgi:hypothetical protein